MIVYCYRNTHNDKRYIGITQRSPCYRQSAHRYASRTVDLPFYRAIRQYGWDAFEYTVLAETDNVEELKELECYYIRHYDSYHNGYNGTDGGEARELRRRNRRTLSEAMQQVHRNISEWELTRNGVTFNVVNLKKWCRDKNYNASCIQRIAMAGKGRHRDITAARRIKTLKESKDAQRRSYASVMHANASMEQPVIESDYEVLVNLYMHAHDIL